ncbi:MAG TPA: amidohydrolase family protein, partial [Roseiflexaceae bacterium]|nr:amidohydrolase family protein [Roseiflexaceae bacterium]
MPKDLVHLVQSTFLRLIGRHPTRQFRTIGALRAGLAVLLLLPLAACTAPPAPPAANAADVPTAAPTLQPTPTEVPTRTATPTRLPTHTATPTLAPTPTETPAPTAIPHPQYDLVLVGGTLIDATGAPPLQNAVIAIQDGRFARIGTIDMLRYSDDTPVVDVRGATIMPGFINAHVHITGLADDDLRRWTRAGVTTIRDLAGPLIDLTATRDRIRAANDPTLPRLLAAGPIVTVDGGYPLSIHENALRVEGLAVRDPDDARAIVATLADGGADQIKLAVSGRTDVHWMELTDDEIAAITAAAHARGLRVSAHVDRNIALRRAVLN